MKKFNNFNTICESIKKDVDNNDLIEESFWRALKQKITPRLSEKTKREANHKDFNSEKQTFFENNGFAKPVPKGSDLRYVKNYSGGEVLVVQIPSASDSKGKYEGVLGWKSDPSADFSTDDIVFTTSFTADEIGEEIDSVLTGLGITNPEKWKKTKAIKKDADEADKNAQKAANEQRRQNALK